MANTLQSDPLYQKFLQSRPQDQQQPQDQAAVAAPSYQEDPLYQRFQQTRTQVEVAPAPEEVNMDDLRQRFEQSRPQEGPSAADTFAKQSGFGDEPDKFSPIGIVKKQAQRDVTSPEAAQTRAAFAKQEFLQPGTTPERRETLQGVYQRAGRQTALAQPSREAERIKSEAELGDTVGKSLKSGGLQIVASLGEMSQWFLETAQDDEIKSYRRKMKPGPELDAKIAKLTEQMSGRIERAKKWSNIWKEKAYAASPDVAKLDFADAPLMKGLSVAVQGIPLVTAGTIATAITKSPIPMALMFGATDGSQTYVEAREAGKDVSKANLYGTLSMAGSMALEYLPLNRILKRSDKAIVRMVKGSLEEGLVEVIQDSYLNLVARGYDKKRAIATVDSMLSSLIGGASLGFITGGSIRAEAGVAEDAKLTPEVMKRIDAAARKRVEEMRAEVAATPEGARTELQRTIDQLTGQKPATEETQPTSQTPEPGQAAEAGVGAASAQEFAPVKPFVTSNKMAQINKDRADRGEPPVEVRERRTNPQAWDEAARQIEENVNRPDELLEELAAKPRAATDIEMAVLLHRKVDIQNELEKALLNQDDARNRGDVAREAHYARNVERWAAELSDHEQITRGSTHEAGVALQAVKMAASEDFSLAKMQLEKRLAKDKPLTAAEQAELVTANKKITALQKQLQDRIDTTETRAVDKAIADVKKPRPKPKAGEKITTKLDVVSSIRNKVEKGQQNDITAGVQKLARMLWESGIREREALTDALHGELQKIIPEITREETQRAFSGYGNYKTLSKEEVDVALRDLRGQIQQLLKIAALEAKKPLEKTGMERRILSDKERRLQQQVNELKRKYGVVVTDPETQLRSALQARKTYYTHRISDLKHEIATRERTVKTKTPSPVDAELAAMKAELEQVKQEHDTIFGPKTLTDEQRMNMAIAAAERSQQDWNERLALAKQGVFLTPEIKAQLAGPKLDALRAETQKIRDQIAALKEQKFPKPTAEEKALNRALKAAERAEERWIQRLALAQQGKFPVPGKAERVSSPEIEAVRTRAEAIRVEVEALKAIANPKLSPEEKALEMIKNRMYKKQLEYADRLARKDFEVKRRVPKELDQEALALQASLDVAKQNFKEGLEKDRYDRSSVFQKAGRVAGDVYDSARNLMTTGELSFLLRQGKYVLFQAPRIWAKGLPNMFRTLVGNETKARALDLQIQNHPMAARLKKDGLDIPAVGERSLSKQNEIAMGRWLGKIPIAARFTRAGQVFLNKIRFDLASAMYNSLSPEGTEGAVITAFVNAAGGSGSLGKVGAQAAVALNRTFFSPKFIASRVQLLIGRSFWDGRGTARTRKLVAKQYAKMLIGMALYNTALGLYFMRNDDEEAKDKIIEGNATSTGFGKIRQGNTRLDVMAGLAQVITVAARAATGKMKTGSGKTIPLRGDKVRFGGKKVSDILGRFARTKLHPVPGAVLNLLDGEDMVGNKMGPMRQAGNLMLPIAWGDMYRALKDEGLNDKTAMVLLAFLGEGLNTYEDKPGPWRSGMPSVRLPSPLGK